MQPPIPASLSSTRAHAPASVSPRSCELTVVVPVLNERANVASLVREIVNALCGVVRYEIVYVDDGSDDGTAEALELIQREVAELRVVRHDVPAGQSAAIRSGVQHARGHWIATLDGDGQNDPADIPMLLTQACALAARCGNDRVLIAGWRQQRHDARFTRVQSRIANAVRSRLLGDATPDSACGLKIFSRELYLLLPDFDHMHRFLPALVRREGGEVVSIAVRHRPRTSGKSHYGVTNRLWTGIVDLVGVIWLSRRIRRPRVTEHRNARREEGV